MSELTLYQPESNIIDALKKLNIENQLNINSPYLSNVFVMAAEPVDPTQTIYVSPDGILWTPAINNPFATGSSSFVCSNNNTILAVGGKNDGTLPCVAYSYDGYNWTTSVNNPFSGGFSLGCCWSETLSMFVAVGRNAAAASLICISYSIDQGKNWLFPVNQIFSGGECQCVAWSPELGIFVAGGKNGSGSVSVAYSSDGKNWFPSTNNPFAGFTCFAVCWSPELSLFIVGGSRNIAYSSDGKTWNNPVNNLFSGGLCQGVAWSPELSLFVAVGGDLTINVTIIYSSDGKNWTRSNTNSFLGTTCQAVCWGGNRFVAVGTNGGPSDIQVNISFDGINWYVPSQQPLNQGIGRGVTPTSVFVPIRGPEGSKTFVINHPLDTDKYLIHACLEGPEAAVYYRGSGVTTYNNSAEIVLPEYVNKLSDYFTVTVSPKISANVELFPMVTSSPVIDGKFTVYSNKPICEFFWLVMGTRDKIDVEVEKSSAIVKGDGPYKYL